MKYSPTEDYGRITSFDEVEVGMGATYLMYTDRMPFEVDGKRGKTVVQIRMMRAELDPEFKLDVVPGGFLGHVRNQDEQKYTYSSSEDAGIREIRYSNSKSRTYGPGWYDKNGGRYSIGVVYKFHDYNY